MKTKFIKRLNTGQALGLDEALVSENGRYVLHLQGKDGNLVLYKRHGADMQQPHTEETATATWASKTNKEKSDATFAAELRMQKEDGHLVLYAKENKVIWATQKYNAGYKDAYAELQNDGNLVVYKPDGQAIWSTGTHNYSNWMEALPGHLTLKQICIPGSHDAGMNYTTNVVKGMALTQDRNIYGQLEAGSRYFDVRVQKWGDVVNDDCFYAFHGSATGPYIRELLADLVRFYDEDTKETCIFSFMDWKSFTGVDDYFIEMVLRIVPKKHLLLGAAGNIAHLELDKLRSKIIILVKNDTMYKNSVKAKGKDGIYAWGKELKIYDDYADTKYYSKMINDQSGKFEKYDNKDELFMLNWTLTPGTLQVLPGTSDVKDYANEINPQVTGADAKRLFYKRNNHQQKVNIINHDYVGTGTIMDACKAINNLP